MVEPLKFFFKQFPQEEGALFWDPDEKKTTIEIGTVNDFNKVPLQIKPRILVNRGNYTISKSGLTDNMTQAPGIKSVFGASERKNMVWVNGVAQIIIESTQEGTCELITDMVTHFIAGTRPFICNDMGFKEFGLDMGVSSCEVDREDTEKFKVVLNVPYSYEDHWMVRFDAIKFKAMYLTLMSDDLEVQSIAVRPSQS
jgi:hypothetical protein